MLDNLGLQILFAVTVGLDYLYLILSVFFPELDKTWVDRLFTIIFGISLGLAIVAIVEYRDATCTTWDLIH